MFSSCGVGEDSRESLGLQGDQTSKSYRKSTLNIHWKDWCWSWSSNPLATGCEKHWKIPWCWERLRAGGEGDDRGWDGQMASPMRWTWVWASSGSWWWTGTPGMLQSIGFQRVGHDWTTELNWTMLPKTYWALDTTRHHPEGSLWMSAFKRQTSPMTQAQSLPVFVTHEEPKARRLEGIFWGHPLVSDRPRV